MDKNVYVVTLTCGGAELRLPTVAHTPEKAAEYCMGLADYGTRVVVDGPGMIRVADYVKGVGEHQSQLVAFQLLKDLDFTEEIDDD